MQICNPMELMPAVRMLAIDPSDCAPTKSSSERTITTPVATIGVWSRGCTRPSALGRVLSRPMANIVRVTWINVVSIVATVDSTTAATISLPPQPCHTA